MEFYHASKMALPIGEEIRSGVVSLYYEEATEALDSNRPESAPARKTALYSADSLEFAFYFLIKQNVCKSAINLYKVKVKHPWKAVFSIPHIVQRRIEEGKNIVTLINEYWEPTKNWQFYEYLSTSFVVIEQMDHPVIFDFEMKMKGLRDHELADQFS
ncbi:hypothetical protein ES703_65031 [subsurface metagenome]